MKGEVPFKRNITVRIFPMYIYVRLCDVLLKQNKSQKIVY